MPASAPRFAPLPGLCGPTSLMLAPQMEALAASRALGQAAEGLRRAEANAKRAEAAARGEKARADDLVWGPLA
jgi:hypothetical protein